LCPSQCLPLKEVKCLPHHGSVVWRTELFSVVLLFRLCCIYLCTSLQLLKDQILYSWHCDDTDQSHCNSSFRLYWYIFLKMVSQSKTCQWLKTKKQRKRKHLSVTLDGDNLLWQFFFLLHASVKTTIFRRILWTHMETTITMS
jgi:hypothetical protein